MAHTPNPVQKVTGFVQQSKEITVALETIYVQQTFPNATIEIFQYSDDDAEIPAYHYDKNGLRLSGHTITADENGYYELFLETGYYHLKFSEGDIRRPFKRPLKVESRTYNVKDYGAKGDGETDDTSAIRAAIDAMIAHNEGNVVNGAGTLFFPSGRYIVSKQDLARYLFVLPSGIIVQGTAGPYSGTVANNCQIVLTSSDTTIFHIPNNRHKIAIRDIGLTTHVDDKSATFAIECKQDVADGYTTNLEFSNLTIWNFEHGIMIDGPGILDANNVLRAWDISGLRIDHCHIGECTYCIRINAPVCDFSKITNSRIAASTESYGIYMEKVGNITIDSILGAGSLASPSQTFIYLTPVHAAITISNSECEGYINSIELADSENGNLGWPILVSNCAFGTEVLLQFNCDYVSIGNRYAKGTVKCAGHGDHVRIFSFGDISAPFGNTEYPPYPGDIPEDNFEPFYLQGLSRIATRVNRYRMDSSLPASFGGNGGAIMPRHKNVSLSVALLEPSQFNLTGDGEIGEVSPDEETNPKTQIALCALDGTPQFNIRTDAHYLYFEDSNVEEGNAPVRLMRLDRSGNLVIRGAVSSNPNL